MLSALSVNLEASRQFTIEYFGIHYENTPIQIYRKFYHQKVKIFR